jgi:hypothetical protein
MLLCLPALACNLSFTIPDEVTPTPRPPLVFIAPENGNQLADGAPIQLAARAEDALGVGVVRIDFAVDGVALGSQEVATPQRVLTALQVWQASGLRDHLLTASAFRPNNELLGTVNITVRVVTPPTPGAALPATPAATLPVPSPVRVVPTVPTVATAVPTTAIPTASRPPATLPQPTAAIGNQPQAKIITPFLNMRSGPGANYPTIGQVKAGDIVIILGRNEDRKWWAVQAQARPDLRGWILNNPAYIEVSGDVSSVPLAAAKPSPTPG